MMDTAPTAEAVYESVYAMYNNPDNTEKEKASRWLTSLQKSVFSWTIADELLQQKRDLQSCYFAAQTMRNKIQNSFHELPADAHDSLRNSLITHIGQITDDTDHTIVTQLCLALADVALLMSAWSNPIGDLIERLGSQPATIWPLIVTLGLVPEEINSRYLRLGENRRLEVFDQLKQHSATLCELLAVSLAHYARTGAHRAKALSCFGAWTSVHCIAIGDFRNSAILAHCFQLLADADSDPKLHEAAADCLCTVFLCLEETSDNGIIDAALADVEAQCFQQTLSLEDAYHLSVAHEDSDRAMNLCRVFTALGESFLQRIVGEPAGADGRPQHFAFKSLDLVLNCAGHYDYEVCEITFHLWFRLSEELYQRNSDELQMAFQPYVQRLIGAMYRHVQMDADHDGLIDADDTFGDFRRKVAELIRDVAFIVGSSVCFREMYKLLQTPQVSWEASEAALFVMQNVAKNIMPDENDVVPKVLEAILALPDGTHIAVRFTSIMIVGELCEWVEAHPDSLEAVLNFLLHALQQRNGLAAAGATALTSIFTICRQRMVRHLAGIVQIAASLDTFEISNESAIGLLRGMAMIVSRLPGEQIRTAVQEIGAFQMGPLRALLDADVPLVRDERSDPCFWLDRLAVLLRYTVPPRLADGEQHPCVAVMNESWPIVLTVLKRFQTDGRIMERAVRCIRYMVRCVGRQAAPLLEPLVEQMVALYEQHLHSCFLYLGSILVDEFAAVGEQCTQGLLHMLQAFVKPTFELFQRDNGLKDHPDTVDDFFRLCSRYIQRCGLPFLQSPIVAPTMQCALLACTLDHRDANVSVMKFLCNVLSCGFGTPDDADRNADDDAAKLELVMQLVAVYQEQLVVQLLNASVFFLHGYMLNDVADVLVLLRRIDERSVLASVRKALSALPKRNSGGGVTATDAQVDEFYAAIQKSNSPKSVTMALKDFTRLYR